MSAKKTSYSNSSVILTIFAAVSIVMILVFWIVRNTGSESSEKNLIITQKQGILSEKLLEALEYQILSSYGQIVSSEKLIGDLSGLSNLSNKSTDYKIILKRLEKQKLLNLIKQFALKYSLKSSAKLHNSQNGRGLRVNLTGSDHFALVIIFEVSESSQIGSISKFPVTPKSIRRDRVGDKKLVVIIDDIGNDYPIFKRFLRIQHDITFAILPLLPMSGKMGQEAHAQDREVILHLPMQPQDMFKYDPGPGVLLIEDSPYEIALKMQKNFSSIRYAVGTNNHMGSAFTQDRAGLESVMKILKENDLFFIDSKTAPGNIARMSASNNSVPYLSRNIFLDNEQNTNYISRQLDKAINIALKSGHAIAIGHTYPETAKVLEMRLKRMADLGITVVPASSLLNTQI